MAALLAFVAGFGLQRWLVSTDTDGAVSGPDFESGTWLGDTGRQLAPFALEGADGTPFSEADLEGRTTLLFFGFTNCPDVCPTTLATLAGALADLRGERPDVVFVKASDPGRDTAEAATTYARAFRSGVYRRHRL